MADATYGPMEGEADVPAVARLIAHAFAGVPDRIVEWLRTAGLENVRVMRGPGGRPLASLIRHPMGQFFGGRAVPMVGIAGVAVAPESRGRGLARELMREAVRQSAAEGAALSCLYASTQSLYRQVGYEQAGHRMLVTLPVAHIDVRERGGEVAALSEADDGAVRACYGEFARRFDGMLDRGAYAWGRIRKFRDEDFYGFGVRAGNGLDGYLFLAQRRKPTGRQEIALTDLVFNTPAAGRRLLGFLADFAPMADEIVFPAGPAHPALMLLAQQRYRIEFKDYWMLRVVDVRRALEARGYRQGVEGRVELEIADDLIPSNNGRFVLNVREGKGTVETGGRGELRMGVRGLAALYSGFLSPKALELCGLVEGNAGSGEAEAVFAGGTPWMTDFF